MVTVQRGIPRELLGETLIREGSLARDQLHEDWAAGGGNEIGRSMSPDTGAPQPGLYVADHRSSGPLLTVLRYRELLRQLVIQEIKLRYKRSVLGFAMIAMGAGFGPTLLWLPIPLLSLACFALGVALLLGMFNVFFRDVKYFYEAGLLAWFYATAIFYPPEIIPSQFKFLLDVNPMYGLLESLRALIYRGTAPSAIIRRHVSGSGGGRA